MTQLGPIVADRLTPPLIRALEQALDGPSQRVRRIEAGGQMVWLKQGETLSLRWRLQKGDTRRAFANDLDALHRLGAAGLPVAPILAEGLDFFVTPDRGRALSYLLQRPAEVMAEARQQMFAEAGRALAALHRAGFAHGRPSIRDMLWDGQQITLIDFERFSPRHNRVQDFATDLMILAHSILSYGRGPVPELEMALAAYRAADPGDVWATAQARARKLGWLGVLTRAVARLRPRSRDLNAVPLTLDRFARG